MKNCLLLENLMVHVDGDHNDCIAIVVPNMGEILKFAKSQNIPSEDNVALLKDKRVIKFMLDDMAKVGRKYAVSVYMYSRTLINILVLKRARKLY